MSSLIFLTLHAERDEMTRAKIGPSHPDFSKAKPFRTDRRATHALVFFADLKPIAAKLGVPVMITYPYVLAVCEGPSQDIVYLITAENTTYGTAAFCSFDQNGNHANFGSWPVNASKEQFIERATEMAERAFNLSPSLQVIEQAPRKRWFGIF
jgi:hypothetical protein